MTEDKLKNIENWVEVADGIYLYKIDANLAYEIHITRYEVNENDLLTYIIAYKNNNIASYGMKIYKTASNASLFIVGNWYDNDTNTSFFERECLYEGSFKECLNIAYQDYNENMKWGLSYEF